MITRKEQGLTSKSDVSDTLGNRMWRKSWAQSAMLSMKHGTATLQFFVPAWRPPRWSRRPTMCKNSEIANSTGFEVLSSTWHQKVVLVPADASRLLLSSKGARSTNTNDEACSKPLQSHNRNVGGEISQTMGTRYRNQGALTTMMYENRRGFTEAFLRNASARASSRLESKPGILAWQHWELRPLSESQIDRSGALWSISLILWIKCQSALVCKQNTDDADLNAA